MDQKALCPVAFSAAAAFAADRPADGSRAFTGVAYSGDVVTDHPFFERVAFDLASTKLATPAPVLFNHFEPIGVIDDVELGNEIGISGKIFADVQGSGSMVAQFADRGMPWQMSVGIWPGRIEEVKAGAKVDLNGRKFDGPLTVFRDNRVREVSFCALGADDKTNAQIFTIGGNAPRVAPPQQESENMEQAEHDRIVAELAATHAAELETLTTKVAELTGRLDAQAAAQREAEVKSVFEATGRAFTPEAAAPYLAMTPETFALVAADLKAGRPALDPKLTTAQATSGASTTEADNNSTESIRKRAREYIASQAALGISVGISEAVTFVTKAGTTGAAV